MKKISKGDETMKARNWNLEMGLENGRWRGPGPATLEIIGDNKKKILRVDGKYDFIFVNEGYLTSHSLDNPHFAYPLDDENLDLIGE